MRLFKRKVGAFSVRVPWVFFGRMKADTQNTDHIPIPPLSALLRENTPELAVLGMQLARQ